MQIGDRAPQARRDLDVLLVLNGLFIGRTLLWSAARRKEDCGPRLPLRLLVLVPGARGQEALPRIDQKSGAPAEPMYPLDR